MTQLARSHLSHLERRNAPSNGAFSDTSSVVQVASAFLNNTYGLSSHLQKIKWDRSKVVRQRSCVASFNVSTPLLGTARTQQ